MICPKCKEEGKTSEIRVGAYCTTAMYCEPFYDKDGVYHNHDMNINRGTGSCSNGHKFEVIVGDKCPNCDYGKAKAFKPL